MDIKELVNAFNLNNYFSDKINANFTVEGKKIVGLFASSTNIGEYLRRMEKEIIERHYLSGTEVAGAFYNLNCFPFVLGANPDKEYLGNGIVKVKLADSTDKVIHNLKVHFANEFKRAVISKVVARLQKAGITKKEAYEWIKGTVKTGAIGKPYLYCIAFSDEYFERECDEDPSETFEMFKEMYIQEFNSRLEACGLKSSDFYEYKDDMLYIKDVSDKVVESVARYVKKEVALDFRTPGTEDSKVENFKDVLGDFIFKWTEKSINAYEYDIFTDKKKIENGNDFVLIPLTKRYSGQLESLKHKDAYKINTIHKDFVSDIRGKTAKPDVTSYENPVYAISNKRIAQLLPEIMQSPIAYNERNGRFEFAVDLENFKRRGSSRSSSTVTSPFNSPTHAGPSGLETPPNQRKGNRDSGIGESPPRPEGSVAHSSSGGPSSYFTESLSPIQEFPRHESRVLPHVRHNVGPAEVVAAKNVQAGTSAWTQQTNRRSLSAPSAGFRPQAQVSSSGLSSWKSANPVGANLWAQRTNLSGLSWKSAAQNVRTTWYVPFPLTTGNDPTSSNPEFSARSPGVEDVNGVESEKQQVIVQGARGEPLAPLASDENDRESSDECSEAKSQKSESPKKHGGGLERIKNFLSFNCKPKQHKASLKRYDTVRSMPEVSVTKKPLLSKRSASEKQAKRNPPSKVTSPMHEGAPGGLKPLTSDERKELRPFLSPELQKKLDSNSFSPGKEQHLYLTHTLSGKREIKNSFENPEENLRRSANAQLPSSDNLSSKKVNKDSGFCSIESASPAVPHKGSVSSELKHLQQVKHMSEALGK